MDHYMAVLICYSAGIGRTGTFIALDMLLRQAEVETTINVPATVKGLRQDRVNMVQTQVKGKSCLCIENLELFVVSYVLYSFL